MSPLMSLFDDSVELKMPEKYLCKYIHKGLGVKSFIYSILLWVVKSYNKSHGTQIYKYLHDSLFRLLFK